MNNCLSMPGQVFTTKIKNRGSWECVTIHHCLNINDRKFAPALLFADCAIPARQDNALHCNPTKYLKTVSHWQRSGWCTAASAVGQSSTASRRCPSASTRWWCSQPRSAIMPGIHKLINIVRWSLWTKFTSSPAPTPWRRPSLSLWRRRWSLYGGQGCYSSFLLRNLLLKR